MFGNLNWYNVVVLLLLALFIFGDRLPKVISDGLRMLRQVRGMAQNATNDLSRELGTDIQLTDLHPKTFIRKHLISEADQEALVRPLKGISDDLLQQTRGIGEEVKEVGRTATGAASDVKRAARLRPTKPRPASTASSFAGTSTSPATTPKAAAPEGGSAATETPPTVPRPRYDDIT